MRAAIKAAYVGEVAGFLQIALDQSYVVAVVEPVSDGDGFGGKATVPLFPRPNDA